ncbi:MAG: ISAs1 family transposase [Armatimonadota bacterium]|nr:ISAs1 family transposase [Armatimonadota bacterium]
MVVCASPVSLCESSKEYVPLSLIEHFIQMPDPRMERTREHKLIDIIVIAICAMLCGADSFVAIADFGEDKEEWLRQRLELPNGIPSHDTFRRVFGLLNPEAFRKCFLSWTEGIRKHVSREIIAVDGKTLRHSFDHTSEQSAIHMVSAWAASSRLVLGQTKVNDKSNEITAIPEVLRLLDISGCIVTIDAMGCQRGIATQIIEQGGDYVLALKGNQGTLHNTVERFFKEERKENFNGQPFDYLETIDKDHGRIEKRRYWLVSNVSAWLDPQGEWSGLGSIGMVESERFIQGKTVTETRYFINSLSGKNMPEKSGTGAIKLFSRAVRRHWGIENKVHWVLDVVFREDDCRIRKDFSPQNFATLRHIVLNILNQNKGVKGSLKRRRLRAGWSDHHLEAILGI